MNKISQFAGVGPTESQQIEMKLSEMGIQMINEKAPSMLDYYIGFDLITKNDENTKAAGILGFKVGDEWAYVPVMFLNGKVKGTEVLYLKNSDVFTSLTKQWVEYLTSQHTGVVGEAAKAPVGYDQGTQGMRIFSYPPQGQYKRGFAERSADFSEILLGKGDMEPLEKLKLPNILKMAGEEAYLGFMNDVVNNHPELLGAISKFYDLDELKIEFPKKASDTNSTQGGNDQKKEKRDGKVTFVTRREITEEPAKYSDEVKEKVLKDEIAVLDHRSDEEKSTLVRTNVRERFMNPTENGFYEFLNGCGFLTKALIAIYPFIPGMNRSAASIVIIDPETGFFGTETNPDTIVVRSKLTADDWKDLFKDAPKVTEAKIGKTYILIDERMRISAPLEITNIIRTDDYTEFCGKIPYSISFKSDRSFGLWENQCEGGDSRKVVLRTTDIPTGEIQNFGGRCSVPANWRIMEVSDCCTEEDHDKAELLRKRVCPARKNLITAVLTDHDFLGVNVEKKDFDYTVRVGEKKALFISPFLKRADAYRLLIERMGLSIPDADETLSLATQHGSDRFHVKLARILPGPFPNMDDQIGTVPYSGVPETVERVDSTMLPEEHVPWPNIADPAYGDAKNPPWNNLTPEESESLVAAANKTNSQQVFDPAMIGVLLKNNRIAVRVDEIVPDLVLALDRMCRLLLMFYWHNADFSQMYGSDEMAEFEDILLNNIKNMGTMVLFLKQKSGESPDSNTDALATSN